MDEPRDDLEKKIENETQTDLDEFLNDNKEDSVDEQLEISENSTQSDIVEETDESMNDSSIEADNEDIETSLNSVDDEDALETGLDEDDTGENLEVNVSESPTETSTSTPELDKEALELELRKIQKNLIEGALYAGGRPLDIEEIATKLEISKKIVEELINEIAYDYLERDGALIIAQVGEKYQMQLKLEYTERVSKFAKGGAIAERYLRTLTIIALKQPILKSMVIKLRGSGAYEHVKYLLDNELISAVKKGRSHELTTTDKYSEMFGLPRDKQELKRVMITQLGVSEENTTGETISESEQ